MITIFFKILSLTIGLLMEKSLPRPKISSDAEFMKSLREKVNIVLNGRHGKDNKEIYIKSLVVIACMVSSYLFVILTPYFFLKLVFAISLGFASAGLGFNLFHDANHGSLSVNKKVNKFFGLLSSSLLGAGSYFWKYKHNYLHHQFPNIQNWDDDLETREGLRLSPEQPWKSKYKYQHIYAPFVYGLTTIEWFFIKDYVQYFTLRMNKWQTIPKMKLSDHVEFWLTKTIYYLLFVIIPYKVLDSVAFFSLFFIYHFSYSITLASIFQLAHVMEETQFPKLNEENPHLDKGWAHLQLATTVNFATENKFVTWFSGGLNHQVEHHIFPNISHTFYPVLSSVLKDTCKEFNYPYHEISKYSKALSSHFNILKEFGYNARQKACEKILTEDIEEFGQ